MKKTTFIFLSIVLMTMSVFAQTSDNNTLKFLGIPVDGTKANMIAKLKEKGFTYNASADVLRGKFNGLESDIFISTNYGKVDRIVVVDRYGYDEAGIKARYNNLVSQMDKNQKYFSLIEYTISDDDDISYEMKVNNKRFDAWYFLTPNLSDAESAVIGEKIAAHNPETEDEAAMIAVQELIENYVTGNVWFMIQEEYGKYYIYMYYDNLKNRPNGEDL